MTLHLVVPEGVDDPQRPSGGNVYDRRLCRELRVAGWDVREHSVAGQRDLGRLLAELPDRATVLVDGLVGASAEAMGVQAARLRLVLLLHMAVAERDVLHAVDAVVTTSRWARQWVIDQHGLDPDRVHVAVPGVDVGPRVSGSAAGSHLLCVGPVTPDKGYDVLLGALSEVSDLEWRCTCVGALDLDPAFVGRLPTREVADRVTFTGPLTPARLDAVRSTTDLVVSASRRESFGMAVAEGLARGIPVVATEAGGQPEAVGPTGAGLLVPPGDVGALAAALRRWLTEPGLRDRLRGAAADRRTTLTTWTGTARVVADVVNRPTLVPVSMTSEPRLED
jgi:glycosyltransferase involved in cell wall biosynthesis